MNHRRQSFQVHHHCLALLLSLVLFLATPETLKAEQNFISPFPTRSAQLDDALKTSAYTASAALKQPLVFEERDFARLFGDDFLITSFQRFMDGPDTTISAFSTKDGALAISLELTQIVGADRMVESLVASFDTISAPLDGLEPVRISGTDVVLRLSLNDNFAVAARGDILVQASTGPGLSASEAAAMLLKDVFTDRQ